MNEARHQPKWQAIQISYTASDRTGGRGKRSRRHPIQSTTQPVTFLCFSVASLKMERAVPPWQPTPPSPRKNKSEDPTPQEKTMECVKNAHWWAISFWKSQTKKEKKSTMPVLFPLNIYTLDSNPCSHTVGNRCDKHGLRNDQSVHPQNCTSHQIHKAAILRGRKHCLLRVSYGIIIYSKNGHVPRLNFYFFLLSFTVE